jgi:hypothetical protein
MRSSLWWLERLTANVEVATVLGTDTVESEGRQMKQCLIQYTEKKNKKFKKFKSMTLLFGWKAGVYVY